MQKCNNERSASSTSLKSHEAAEDCVCSKALIQFTHTHFHPVVLGVSSDTKFMLKTHLNVFFFYVSLFYICFWSFCGHPVSPNTCSLKLHKNTAQKLIMMENKSM